MGMRMHNPEGPGMAAGESLRKIPAHCRSLHPGTPARDEAVGAAVRNQRKSSDQEAVLLVRTTTHESFRQKIPKENTLDPVRAAAGQERLS